MYTQYIIQVTNSSKKNQPYIFWLSNTTSRRKHVPNYKTLMTHGAVTGPCILFCLQICLLLRVPPAVLYRLCINCYNPSVTTLPGGPWPSKQDRKPRSAPATTEAVTNGAPPPSPSASALVFHTKGAIGASVLNTAVVEEANCLFYLVLLAFTKLVEHDL